ncbi:MAG: hypothetical protein HC915_20115 [Anaerolineae bacterium]|nr:hypothetical protein [Anaerolineae bacterium]
MGFHTKHKTPAKTHGATPAQPTPPRPLPSAHEATLRELYERIAQGHALSEAEAQAQRKWQGQ